jgi:hypothetical protein
MLSRTGGFACTLRGRVARKKEISGITHPVIDGVAYYCVDSAPEHGGIPQFHTTWINKQTNDFYKVTIWTSQVTNTIYYSNIGVPLKIEEPQVEK